MSTNKGIFLKDDMIVQETIISERNRSCRKKFKVTDMETDGNMDSAHKRETTNITSVFTCILEYIGL